MAKSRFKLYIYGMILLLLFLGLIRIFITESGKFFALELLGFSFLLLLSLIGFIGYSEVWGERVFFFVFLFYFVNLILIWKVQGALYLVLLLLTLIGFLMSIPKKKSHPDDENFKMLEVNQQPHSEVFDPVVKEEKSEKNIVEVKKEPTLVKAKHSPGKYVASSYSTVYHEPKCEWAKRISVKRRIWFKDKREATNKKYKKHSCVK